MKESEFKLQFDTNCFNSKDILNVGYQKVEVIKDPHRKWWKVLLEWVTFRWYKCPYEYTVKIYNEKEESKETKSS